VHSKFSGDYAWSSCIALAVTAVLYEAVCAAVDQYGDRVHAHLHDGLRHGLWTLQRDAAALARDLEPPVYVDALSSKKNTY
jgi:hypothetical protein